MTESKEGVSVPSNPRAFVGLDIDTQGANHVPDAYPKLLDRAMQAFGVKGGATAPRDCSLSAPNVGAWSILVDADVRFAVDEDHSSPPTGLDRPTERTVGIIFPIFYIQYHTA